METYTVLEASEILHISTRAVQKRCLKDNVRKKSNRYLITTEHIDKWYAELKSNEPPNEPVRELEALSTQIEKLEAEIEQNAKVKAALVLTLKQYEKGQKMMNEKVADLESEQHAERKIQAGHFLEHVGEKMDFKQQIKSLQLENESLKAELKQYDVSDNERIEIFTNEEYTMLETRLREWTTQQQQLQHQEELFNVEKLGLKELLDHYKKQFEYQKQQSEKILNMHQTLIDTIQKQNAIAIQRNIIEAADKDVIDKDLKRKD